jgi:hypothetical protein
MAVMPELGASNEEGARSGKVALMAEEVDTCDWSGKMQALG